MTTNPPAKTTGELLAELLDAYGVDTVFGIPGVHTVELYRGLPNTHITHITPRHEQGAGFMADGYARVTGKPGVCFIITGPGMTNIMTALGQAAADSVPLLVISSVNPIAATGSGEGRLHELADQQGMTAHLTAFTKTVYRPEDLPKIVAEAFSVFASTRPRPIHIQIPIDVITADASHIAATPAGLTRRPEPNAAALDNAAALLNKAKNPILLYGGGCADVNPHDAMQLAELLDCPTLLTINAKGLLPPAHPLSLGSNQSITPARQAIAAADTVLAIGTELGETDYDVVFDGGFTINGTLIRVDIDPRQVQLPFPADCAIVGDAAAAIRGLCARLTPAQRHGEQRAHALRQAITTHLPDHWRGANAMLKALRDHFPNLTIVGDSTQPVYFGNHGFEAAKPRRWFNASTGYGTLGYALPAAIGAQIGRKNDPVICLIGDGGIQFTLPELIVATENHLPVIIIIWHNQGYGEIRRYMQARNLPLIGVNIAAPDFDLSAQSVGALYRKIESLDELLAAVENDRKGQRPAVYEIDETAPFLNDIAQSFQYFS